MHNTDYIKPFLYVLHYPYFQDKRISINEKNTKTSEITVPYHDEHPAYFFLRNCEAEITKGPIQVDFSDDPSKKIS